MAAVIFLKQDSSREEINSIRTLLENSEKIETVRFIGKTQAMNQFKEKFPELQDIIDSLEDNPFPPAFEAVIKDEFIGAESTLGFLRHLQSFPGIDEVQFHRDWVEKVQSFGKLTRAVGLFLGGILVMASFFIISNVIRLNVLARKDEIEILRLTGASNMFIRVPFLMEGIMIGALGGILSLLALFLLIQIFPVYLGTSLGALSEFIKFRHLTLVQACLILLVGGGIGFLGSLSSLSKFLKT
ncbi:MAG: permease-like cell division protein FtsX [Candidatus Aminicenantes bacterium]